MKYKQYTVHSPEVKAILFDVLKSGTGSYYRISPDGKHVACRIKQELTALGMCSSIVSRLLREADLPVAAFIHNRTVNKPKREIDATVELYEVECGLNTHLSMDTELSLTTPIPRPTEAKTLKKTGPKAMTEDEREGKRLKAEELENEKRYALVETRSGKHGIWDDDNATVVSLFWTKEEALEELARMRTGRAYAGCCNWGSYRKSPGQLE